jgi:hypothetical protein
LEFLTKKPAGGTISVIQEGYSHLKEAVLMDLGDCSVQGKIRTSKRIVQGRIVVFHVPKSRSFTVEDVESFIEEHNLNRIKMVPPGVITPWRFACKVAHFKGDVLQAMETLTAESRHFYHKAIFP